MTYSPPEMLRLGEDSVNRGGDPTVGVRYRQLIITQIDGRRFSEQLPEEILQEPTLEKSVSLDFFEHQVLQGVSKNRVSVPKDLPHPPPSGGWGTLLNGTEIRSVD